MKSTELVSGKHGIFGLVMTLLSGWIRGHPMAVLTGPLEVECPLCGEAFLSLRFPPPPRCGAMPLLVPLGMGPKPHDELGRPTTEVRCELHEKHGGPHRDRDFCWDMV